MAETSENVLSVENGMYVANASMKVNGNLDVTNQISATGIKINDSNGRNLVTISKDGISFRKACQFLKQVDFNNGQTKIGIESTYNSAYVGSPTIHAGRRFIVGDSTLKIDSSEKTIIADIFSMTLKKLVSDAIQSKKATVDLVESKNLNVSNQFIGQTIYADTIKTSNLYIEAISCLRMTVGQTANLEKLDVNGTATFNSGVNFQGIGTNGAALTVNGGKLIANKGIESHGKNNLFQCLEIIGSGTDHDTCFKIGKDVDSVIEGDVSIRDSNLILDNSQLVTDKIRLIPLAGDSIDETSTRGIDLTTDSNWNTYQNKMVEELPADRSFFGGGYYDPYASVKEAMDRNESNYEKANRTVRTLTDPINYAMEHGNPNVPKKFVVRPGLHRIDASGNTLMKNMVAENARFSNLEAFSFRVNQLSVDKMVTTSVASNVVDTDNLLKSRGLAEFDGTINSAADVFIESGSTVNVDEGASVVFQGNSSLVVKNGANLDLGSDSKVKMSGDIEMDLAKLVFVDSATGYKYKISFREVKDCAGNRVVMDYQKIESQPQEPSNRSVALNTEKNARELKEKLKTLGI